MRQHPTRIMILSLLIAFAASPGGLGAANPAGGAQPAPRVVKRAVTFKVGNVNRTDIACASDGLEYDVKGHLVGPAPKAGAAAREATPSVTLYLHSASFGEFFWSFRA